MKNSLRLIAISIALWLGLLSISNAAAIPYSNAGSESLDLYSFTATTTGEIGAYFFPVTAGYTNTLSLSVNGVVTPESSAGVLDNQTSSVGDFVVLGYANAGDVLTFQLNVLTIGDTWYSNRSSNIDGVNHVFTTPFSGDAANGIPLGTYVGFEDLYGGTDLDYDDGAYVFTNVSVSPVPEPGTYAMLLVGLGLVGFSMRRRSVKTPASFLL